MINIISEQEMLKCINNLISEKEKFMKNNKGNKTTKKEVEALRKLVADYKLYRKAAFELTREKQEDSAIWISENIKRQKVEILSIWEPDFDDVRCNAILYEKNKVVANIIECFDKNSVRYNSGNTGYIKKRMQSIIYKKFDYYMKLPKISMCSNLLQEIYDSVCASDASMCHITEKDWNDYYSNQYNKKDLKLLNNEVKKYKLNDTITFNDAEYKIIGWGDLELRFNDDRDFKNRFKNKTYSR